MNQVGIAVNCSVDEDGIIVPRLVYWGDGRRWTVERVLHTCRSPDLSFSGVRYTVLIEGAEKYLYRDDTRWYVDAPMLEEKHWLQTPSWSRSGRA